MRGRISAQAIPAQQTQKPTSATARRSRRARKAYQRRFKASLPERGVQAKHVFKRVLHDSGLADTSHERTIYAAENPRHRTKKVDKENHAVSA